MTDGPWFVVVLGIGVVVSCGAEDDVIVVELVFEEEDAAAGTCAGDDAELELEDEPPI